MTLTGRLWLVSASGLALMTAGCQTVGSHYVGEGQPLDTATQPAPLVGVRDGTAMPAPPRTMPRKTPMSRQDGIIYFLPRQLAKVTARRTEKQVSGAIDAIAAKQGAQSEAEANVAGIKVAIEKTENTLIAAGDDAAVKKILTDRLIAQRTALANAETAATEAKAAFGAAKADLRETIGVRRAEKRYAAALSAAKDASAAKTKAEKSVDDLSKAVGALDAIISGPPPGGTIEQRIELAKKRVELDQAQKDLNNKIKALSAAKADAEAIAAETPDPRTADYAVTLKIELQAPRADPAQAFRLDPIHSIMRDDEHKITVSPAGLLSTADVTATDRTADIIVEIATFAGAIAGLPMGKSGFRDGDNGGDGPENYCENAPDDYIGLVDFADAASVQRLNRDLQCLGIRVVAEGRYWKAATRPVETQPGKGINGIVYRMPIDVQVRIERCIDKAGKCLGPGVWFPTEMLALSLPQAGPISFLQQRAGFATKTKYASVFKDGILTSYEDNRPSEGLQVAATPMRVLNGVFEGISKVISLRTGQNNALAGLSASQLAVLNAQIGYDVAKIGGQRQLSEAERTLLEARIALQAATTNGERTLTEAQIALLEKQVALQTGQINGQKSLSAAELALIQQQYALQAGQLNGQGSVAAAQLALLQNQAGVTLGTNTLQAQLSASELALAKAVLRNNADMQLLRQCVAEHDAASIDICFK